MHPKVRPAARGADDLRYSADNRPMNRTLLRAAALPVALCVLQGCSPALNWRSVPLPDAGITITLPCKPDHATRTVVPEGASYSRTAKTLSATSRPSRQ